MKKLEDLNLASLAKEELGTIRGGAESDACSRSCGCACDYASTGGSSSYDNGMANRKEGKSSPGMNPDSN
jgi:natural product precursor